MSDNEVIIRLTTVALLVGFLLYKQWERARKRAAQRREFQFKGEVTTINVAPLRAHVEEVRRDFTPAAHVNLRCAQAREGLVAAARRKLSCLRFFRGHSAPSESESHAPLHQS